MKVKVIGESATLRGPADHVNKDLHVFWVTPKKESSQIAGYAYNEATQLLALKFVKGGVFTYKNVPSYLYNSLVKVDQHHTESLGSWLGLNITRGKENQEKYPYTKEN